MKRIKVAASMFAAGLMAGAQADTLLSESFDSVAALPASGWVLTNASTPVGQSWFQGNDGIFPAFSGAVDSYVAANFNSTTAVTGVVDNWLITPELAVGSGSTLTFFTRASDTGFLDKVEVLFSSGAGSAVSGFTTLLAAVGSSSFAAYPTGAWIAFTVALPTASSGRIAFHYSVANALDASYVGIDSVMVTSPVLEPTTAATLALGIAALALARRRLSANRQA